VYIDFRFYGTRSCKWRRPTERFVPLSSRQMGVAEQITGGQSSLSKSLIYANTHTQQVNHSTYEREQFPRRDRPLTYAMHKASLGICVTLINRRKTIQVGGGRTNAINRKTKNYTSRIVRDNADPCRKAITFDRLDDSFKIVRHVAEKKTGILRSRSKWALFKFTNCLTARTRDRGLKKIQFASCFSFVLFFLRRRIEFYGF